MEKIQKILAIETSNELCSAAIIFDENNFDERNILLKHVHSEKLIPTIEELLNSNKISTKELTSVAVSIGPGSFTGLRIGLTAAKAIAFTSNLPIIPVPTFSALALEISDYLKSNSEYFIVNNANIEECYFSKFISEEFGFKEIITPKLILKNDFNNFINEDSLIFGNIKNVKNIKLINSPRASYIGKWSYFFGRDLLTFDYDFLEPNYLKDFKIKRMQ
ncbi:MAG: tRNA (adenosine(37)-N6)-threonylcarbamoyltransferase complex dimerization subunit type 1 TsaB [Ignavibacteriae bacterium]|nr:tRNA (adenosine(37)-N6)-threonylcarbamoyltransferase complex dimerization subunit type 1 TsaB [Ignavibacteriota bacterium]